VQDQLFKDIKSNELSFSHGDDADSLKERVTKILRGEFDKYVSVSIDGSSFDSNQHQCIIDAIDN